MIDWMLLLPFLICAASSLLCLVCEPALRAPGAKHRVLPWIATLGLLATALAYAPQLWEPAASLHGMLRFEPLRALLALVVLVAGLCATAGLQASLGRDRFAGGESYALLGVVVLGVLFMIHAHASIALFIGLECASLPLYALVALRRHQALATEGALKYLLMGAVFSALFLYGAALSFGATGGVVFGMPAWEGREALFTIGHLLMIAGLLFKLGAVPFHFWVPDAYSVAPHAITGFMGAVVKVGSLAGLASVWLNLIHHCDPMLSPQVLSLATIVPLSVGSDNPLIRYSVILLMAGMFSILVGNFSALGQTHARRLLAFSSIAQVGYLVLGFVLPGAMAAAANDFHLGAVWVALAAYAVSMAGLMLALSCNPVSEDADHLQAFAGLGRRSPLIGVCATVCLLSMAGLPPTSGFLGKYLIFAGLVAGGHLVIAVIGILLAVVAACFYLGLIARLWADAAPKAAVPTQRPLGLIMLVVTIVLVFGLNVLPFWLAPTADLPQAVAQLSP